MELSQDSVKIKAEVNELLCLPVVMKGEALVWDAYVVTLALSHFHFEWQDRASVGIDRPYRPAIFILMLLVLVNTKILKCNLF